MTFRTKVFFIFLVTVLTSVSLVAYGVTHYTQKAFERMDAQRTQALETQFKKEFAQRGETIVQQVENITNADVTVRMVLDLARPNADASLYLHDANGAAQSHGLDFVEFVNSDGTLVSSAQYPARVGYKNDWVTSNKNWDATGAFVLAVTGTNKDDADRYVFEGFWEQALGDDAGRIEDADFFQGFGHGALDVWEKVKDKL